MKKLEISVRVIGDDGETIVETKSKRKVPFLKEFEKQGFSAAFNDLETAIIEASKEANDEALEKYTEKLSKKK